MLSIEVFLNIDKMMNRSRDDFLHRKNFYLMSTVKFKIADKAKALVLQFT